MKHTHTTYNIHIHTHACAHITQTHIHKIYANTHTTHTESLADENALTAVPTVSGIFDDLVLAHKKEVYVTIVTAQVCVHVCLYFTLHCKLVRLADA